MPPLTSSQVEALLRPIRPERIMHANGQAHVPAYDVAAHLTRVFGFGGWDKEILSLILVNETETMTKSYEGKPGKPAWEVTYACTLRLVVKDPSGSVVATWDDGACGTSLQPQRGEAHDMALKSAISYALKRCAAFGLGDQFGLSLYNKGATSALVKTTLVGSDGTTKPADLESHIEKPQSLGLDEREIGTNEPAASAKNELLGALKTLGMAPLDQKKFIEKALGRDVPKFSDLTEAECEKVLDELAAEVAGSEGLGDPNESH